MTTKRFNWNRGKPRSMGTHQTTCPKSYEMIAEDFGQETADKYLALCERREGMLGIVIYTETEEARSFRKNLDWESVA